MTAQALAFLRQRSQPGSSPALLSASPALASRECLNAGRLGHTLNQYSSTARHALLKSSPALAAWLEFIGGRVLQCSASACSLGRVYPQPSARMPAVSDKTANHRRAIWNFLSKHFFQKLAVAFSGFVTLYNGFQ